MLHTLHRGTRETNVWTSPKRVWKIVMEPARRDITECHDTRQHHTTPLFYILGVPYTH